MYNIQSAMPPQTSIMLQAGDGPSTSISLAAHGVSKVFAGVHGPRLVLDNISLSLSDGEIVALIGHSGCGKSTLLSIFAGLEQPTSGSVTLAGRPIVGPGPQRGVVFQNYSLLPWLSVRENVAIAVDAVYAERPAVERHVIVDASLERVGLTDHADQRPGQISGGMRQRVAIARAFAVNPRVLLLDEPFAALDALTKAALQDELLRIWRDQEQRKTVVIVTHDIDEAILLSDRVVVMTNGPAATLREIITIPLPRPRERRAMLHDRCCTELKEHLVDLLLTGRA